MFAELGFELTNTQLTACVAKDWANGRRLVKKNSFAFNLYSEGSGETVLLHIFVWSFIILMNY